MSHEPNPQDRTMDDADEANGEGRTNQDSGEPHADGAANDTEARYGDDESPA